MEFNDFIQLVSRKRKTVYGIIAMFLLIAAVLIVIQPFKYSSGSQLLVVQEYKGSVDAYTASKSSEYLSGVLASVITSNSFYTKVMSAGFAINTGYYGTTAKDQMKQWENTVSAKSINDSGIIAITVYHTDRGEAEKTLRAINYVLMTQHTAYHGSGDAVKVRLIDQPVTSSFPVKPNIPLFAGSAIALGLVSSLIYIYLKAESVKTGQHRLSFEDVMFANAPQAIPDFQRPPRLRAERPRYTDVQIRGQLPEEAVNNLANESYHYHRPATSPYGHHESLRPDHFETESEPGQTEIDPERLIKQGNMKHILG